MTATATHPALAAGPYQGYVYAYPHKTAYRPLAPAVPLAGAWADEDWAALSLYVHVPFCAMRCGFCNLFTTANPQPHLPALYLDALRREADAVREAVADARFARLAVGGGTPTYLDEAGLDAVFDVAERVMGVDLAATPSGVETSPDTLTASKVAVLRGRGVRRVSIGVQSFVEAEARASGRPQSRHEVDAALTLLTGAGFPALNIDLIYGLPGQTAETWLYSVRRALEYAPAEVYLYPLYVRPLTGLGRSNRSWDDARLALYREGRDLLLDSGYAQDSMRMFHKPTAGGADGPAYCVQDDGMVGLGCGARSYTRGLHYSGDYAVGAGGVRGIIADYLGRDRADFARATHGFALDPGEQRRRYVLQSVLTSAGLDAGRYAARFGSDPADDVPDLAGLADAGLLGYDAGRWAPTPAGLEWSDAVGPWLFSARVRTLMVGYDAR